MLIREKQMGFYLKFTNKYLSNNNFKNIELKSEYMKN